MDFLFQILSLYFEVLSSDRFSRDSVIGEVRLEMEGLEDMREETMYMVKDISHRGSKVG